MQPCCLLPRILPSQLSAKKGFGAPYAPPVEGAVPLPLSCVGALTKMQYVIISATSASLVHWLNRCLEERYVQVHGQVVGKRLGGRDGRASTWCDGGSNGFIAMGGQAGGLP